MRRYLFSALPLLTLLAFGLVAALAALWCRRRLPRVVPVVAAVVIAAAAVVYPISTARSRCAT